MNHFGLNVSSVQTLSCRRTFLHRQGSCNYDILQMSPPYSQADLFVLNAAEFKVFCQILNSLNRVSPGFFIGHLFRQRRTAVHSSLFCCDVTLLINTMTVTSITDRVKQAMRAEYTGSIQTGPVCSYSLRHMTRVPSLTRTQQPISSFFSTFLC